MWAGAGPAAGQATLDRFLSSVDVETAGRCSAIDIHLNRPASYLSHFPVDAGLDVFVRVEPLATTAPETPKLNQRESASIVPGNGAGLVSVNFDPFATSGPQLHLSFRSATAVHVTPTNDSRVIHVEAAAPANAALCFGEAAPAPQAQPAPETTDAGQPVPDDAASVVKEGKRLLASGDAARAALFFTKAVTIGNGAVKQEAQEMLGLARERAGQLAHARAEYETYLKLYPRGSDANRVRDRLNAVLASMDEAAQKQFAAHQLEKGSLPTPLTQAKGGKGDLQKLSDGGLPGGNKVALPGTVVTGGGTKSNFKDVPKDPAAWTWEKNGSLGQYYYRDDNFSASEPSSGSLDRHETFQNEAISSADFSLSGSNADYSLDLRTSVYDEFGFGKQKDVRDINLGTLYVEGLAKRPGVSVRIGRQSKSTGGVFGRFDGVVAGWEVNKSVKLQAVAGSPLYSRSAKPFADGRYFYGASIDYTFPNEAWVGSLYAVEQDIKSVVDRRAIGAELRYADAKMSFFSSADYDIFYNELNNAYATATMNLAEGTTIYATADFRRVPFLLTSNALMGQTANDLSTLVDIFGSDEVQQLATDRTASSRTVSVGATKSLNKDWQLAIDATIADYSGTPASGGVDEIPDPGMEYYASAQLSGMNVLKDNDMLTLALRYSKSESADMYMADAFLRYPVSDRLRINPRLRVSMRDFNTQDRVQYLVMPSVAARYRLNKSWNFEAEVGARWEDNKTATGSTSTLDLLATIGYRHEF